MSGCFCDKEDTHRACREGSDERGRKNSSKKFLTVLFLKDKTLWIDGDEVGVIYLRCGYHPDQYPTEKEWEARLMMERSTAIKSPSIHYHLAGTKKVQQELAKPGQVEKFLGDKAQIESVRDIFTGLYSLDHVSKERKI